MLLNESVTIHFSVYVASSDVTFFQQCTSLKPHFSNHTLSILADGIKYTLRICA